MAQLEAYWKIIGPKTRQEIYTPSEVDSFSSNNMSTVLPSYNKEVDWYSRVMRGPVTRMNSYIQYDSMDNDVDIARGLDIIAEEMTPLDEKTKLPFIIDWQTEDNADISDATIVTVRAALRQFCKLQEIQKRKFGIARDVAKYGDAIFIKKSDTRKWKFVQPNCIIAIEVDEDDIPVFYHIKEASQIDQMSQNVWSNVNGYGAGQNEGKIQKYPADAIVHFSNCDEMAGAAPFGSSLLKPIYRVFRQYTMLEDAVVIYRIVRAPERRVFYIDVGNMNPTQVKRYLENIKNEMRQKRAPTSMAGGREMVDGQYDVASIQEDFFFPVTAGGKGSKVETIPGGSEDFGSNLLKQFQQKMFRGLRIPTSYLGDTGGDAQQPQYSDGKVGVAYFEELRFANFVMRQQKYLNDVFDKHFKIYLKVCGINVNTDLFNISLPQPENFALYKQAAVDADLINGFNNVQEVKYLSRRFILKRYLGLTDDEIQMNELLVKEETGINDTDKIPAIQQLYDPAVYENRKPIVKKLPKVIDSDDSGSSDMGGMEDMGDLGGGDTGDMGGGEISGTEDVSSESSPPDSSGTAPETTTEK